MAKEKKKSDLAELLAMMGGKNAQLMAEYQAAQDTMSKAGTEYVRGIPVVKVFQQTVYSFKAFKEGYRPKRVGGFRRLRRSTSSKTP